jgi:hypothetical protein
MAIDGGKGKRGEGSAEDKYILQIGKMRSILSSEVNGVRQKS